MYGIYLRSLLHSAMNSPTQRRQGQWYGLVAASVVVLAASVRVYQSFQCDLEVMKLVPTCTESKYAIAVSVIGTATAILFSLITTLCQSSSRTTSKTKIARRIEGLGATVMVLIWSVGFGFITFGQGPGRTIGNLFFATWAAFIISWLIVADSYQDWMSNGRQQQGQQQQQQQQPANDNLYLHQQDTMAETELS
jgi:hypothetical protein